MTQLSRALGLAGLTTGAVLASAAGASAQGPSAASPAAALPAVVNSAVGAADPVLALQLDPWARTAVDPLNNAVGTQIADFPPVSTAIVTAPLASGASAGELPGQVVGGLLGGLPVTPAP
jgi:hypothetical protein